MKSIVVKGLIIGGIILGLLIPLTMVKSLTKERKYRREQVINSLGSIWGKPQIIQGIYAYKGGKEFYPGNVSVIGSVNTEIRKKGIFKIPFYKVELNISGTFSVLPNKSLLRIAASDATKITVKKLTIGKKLYGYYNHSRSDFYISSWLPAISYGKNVPFTIKIIVKGLDTLQFLPLGRKNNIKLSSSWSDPNFLGSLLPDKRTISDKGFSAQWIFNSNSVSKSNSSAAFGVGLFLTSSVYTLTDRSIKYGILFIALTFLAFFLFELINTIRIHPFQYSMVGLSLVMFYLLLLSFSEHIHFYAAYFVSALAIIGTITSYSNFVLKTRGKTIVMGVLLVVLYLFLFVLLQLEDYALLLGSLSLFAILSGIMFLTRNIDWYGLQEKINKKFEITDPVEKELILEKAGKRKK